MAGTDESRKRRQLIASYRWALPNHTDSLGLPIGQHVSLAANIGGKRVVRSYTPTSLDSELGYFDLVVKVSVARGRNEGRHENGGMRMAAWERRHENGG